MSTLHQYPWKNLDHCQQRLHLIDSQDALLIYGYFTEQDQHNLLAESTFLTGRCHWLSNKASAFCEIDHINYQEWLTLITEHDKTHTWK